MSDQPDPARVHLGAVEVKLMIIDRDRMADRIDDLEPEEVQTLQAKVNSVFKNPLEAMMKVYEKSLTLTRSEDATDSESKARKREEERKQLEEIKQALESMKWRVYTRDFGDNCYVINNEAKIPLKGQGPKIHIAGFNAFLRNGNAVVTIGLAGNFKQEDFRKEMDHFLSEMDARTAFFRE